MLGVEADGGSQTEDFLAGRAQRIRFAKMPSGAWNLGTETMASCWVIPMLLTATPKEAHVSASAIFSLQGTAPVQFKEKIHLHQHITELYLDSKV